jgi:hypothetical protein
MSIALDNELATKTRPWLTSTSPPCEKNRGRATESVATGAFMGQYDSSSMYNLLPFYLYLADDIVCRECLPVCGINLGPHTFPLAGNHSIYYLLFFIYLSNSPTPYLPSQTPALPTNDSPNAPSESFTTYRIRLHHIQPEDRKTLTSGT